MNKTQSGRMINELKQEFERVFKNGHLNGVVGVLRKYHPSGGRATTETQVLMVGKFFGQERYRRELVPLCGIFPARDLLGRFAGVGFGVIPKGRILIQVPKQSKQSKLSKHQLRKSSLRTARIMKEEAANVRKVGNIKDAKALEARAKRMR